MSEWTSKDGWWMHPTKGPIEVTVWSTRRRGNWGDVTVEKVVRRGCSYKSKKLDEFACNAYPTRKELQAGHVSRAETLVARSYRERERCRERLEHAEKALEDANSALRLAQKWSGRQ